MRTYDQALKSEPLDPYNENDEVVNKLNEFISNGNKVIKFGRLDRKIQPFITKYLGSPSNSFGFEGGLIIDYVDKHNTNKRLIIGYTELGDWIEADISLDELSII